MKLINDYTEKALDNACLKGEKVAIVFQDNSVFSGYIVLISYGYDKVKGGFTIPYGIDCDSDDWAGSEVWNVKRPRIHFELADIKAIHTTKECLTLN